MKYYYLLFLVVLLYPVEGSYALHKHWDGEAGNGLFVDGNNWDEPNEPSFDNTVPGPNDTAYIDSHEYNSLLVDCNVVIQDGDDINIAALNGPHYGSVIGAYSSLVMTGGALTIDGDWQAAHDQNDASAVLIDISGDSVVRVGGVFRLQAQGWWPWEGKDLTINISDNVDFECGNGQSQRGKGVSHFNISGSPRLRFGGGEYGWRFADRSIHYLNITGNPTVIVDGGLRGGDAGSTVWHATIEAGTYDIGGEFKIGDDGGGIINLNGGTFNFGGGMNLACRGGGATDIVTINGAEVHFGGNIEMFTGHGSDSSTTLNMFAGLLTAEGDFHAPKGDDQWHRPNATINLSGGSILCKGSFLHGNDKWYMDVNDAHGPSLMRAGGDAITAINQAITKGRFTHSVTDPDNNAFRLKYMSAGPVSYVGVIPKNRSWGPAPFDGQENVSPPTTLAWNPGDDATSHDVYFGTDKQAVENATKASPEWKGNHGDTSFDPGPVEGGSIYYWRIDEVNGGDVCKGNVWSFKSKMVADFDNDGDVDWGDLKMFVDYWLNVCLIGQWCQGCDINQSHYVDSIDFAIFAGDWLK